MKKVLAVLAVAGLASSAMAQSFDAQVGFRDDHTLSGTPTATEVTVDGSAPVPISVLFGAFNAQGFTNRGMFNFLGTVTINDPATAATAAYRTGSAGSGLRAPYSFGNIETIEAGGTTLNFDANRGAGDVNGVLWNFGEAAPAETYTYPAFTTSPPPGNGGGPDTYFPGERFFVNTGNNSLRDITVTVTGTMQAITAWFATSEAPPEDPETPGFQNLLPAGWATDTVTATFVIHVIPAPGAAALLGLGGLVAARRRR